MAQNLFLLLYPFYKPNNSIDFSRIYYIVICVKGVLNNVKIMFPNESNPLHSFT